MNKVHNLNNYMYMTFISTSIAKILFCFRDFLFYYGLRGHGVVALKYDADVAF